MKDFAALVRTLDQTTKTNAKIAALASYFQTAPSDDKLWCVALFTGRRPKRMITTSNLRTWATEAAQLPDWLFEDTYAIVGDLAETISLILPPNTHVRDHSLTQWIDLLIHHCGDEVDQKQAFTLEAWNGLPSDERFVFNKLITGGFRLGVSQKLISRAIAKTIGQPETEVAHRLMGKWTPTTTTWDDLLLGHNKAADLSKPYPFYLSHPLETPPTELGPHEDWQAEWKWDGIRGQIIVRDGTVFVWSRGEELVTDRFPEFADLAKTLPDGTVLDGEIICWNGDTPLPFAALQKRITRKSVGKKLLDEAPVVMIVYDILEWQGKDIRHTPLSDRLSHLDDCLLGSPCLRRSLPIPFTSWGDLTQIQSTARAQRAEGVMLKRLSSPYEQGRKKGNWWKWKLDPMTVDAVMIYAQAGHGRRANLFTDYTFAVWDGDTLVPFTKAYSGLTDKEFSEITSWVRKNTLQRFGPVRQVTPELVFEIAFEGIQDSPRHKSGIAVRFPRMLRWRRDKPASEANTLQDLRDILNSLSG